MSRPRGTGALIVFLLAAAACAEEPMTALEVESPDPPPSLDFFLPEIVAGRLVATDEQPTGPKTGPARVIQDDDELILDEDPADYYDEVGAIYDARTVVGFGTGYAYSRGEHSYQGNKGQVETTATVSYLGERLGSQSAFRESYGMFLFDGGRVKFIWAQATVYSDHVCGLEVSGASQHRAWWQWFSGATVLTWGNVGQSSSAPPSSQADCPIVTGYGGGGGSSDEDTSGGSGGATCYVSIWYNIYTGEIYDAELLYCDDFGD